MMNRHSRRLLFIAVALLIACAALPATAGATTKAYTVTIAPESVAAGGQVYLSAKVKNWSLHHLGSAELTAPGALSVVSASVSSGQASVAGGVVKLRNLSLPPLATRTATIKVRAGCSAGTHYWSAVAKSAGNVGGWADFTLLHPLSSLKTKITGGGCKLRFLVQPQDAQRNTTITGTDLEPGGPAVSVEVVDSSGARVTSSSAPITLAIGSNPSGGSLAGTTTKPAVAGVATFNNLSIDEAGSPYTLVATSPGHQPATSSPFEIVDVAVRCNENASCSGAVGPLSATASANPAKPDAGFLTLSLNTGPPLDCVGYTEQSADWVTLFVTSPNRSKQAIFRVFGTASSAFTTSTYYEKQLCFGAPYKFATRHGTPLTARDYDGGGVDEYVGLLPDCYGYVKSPCISKRKHQGGDTLIYVEVPPNALDPRYRG